MSTGKETRKPQVFSKPNGAASTTYRRRPIQIARLVASVTPLPVHEVQAEEKGEIFFPPPGYSHRLVIHITLSRGEKIARRGGGFRIAVATL